MHYNITYRNRHGLGLNYVQFDSMPAADVRARMKAAGMYYSKRSRSWIAESPILGDDISRIIEGDNEGLDLAEMERDNGISGV